MLEAQCGAWGSIISAAVHVPLVGGKVVSGEPSGSELLDTGGGRRLLNVAVCILCSLPAHHLAKVLGSLLAGMVLLPPLATSCCVLTKYDVPSPPTRAESVALHGQDVAVPMALISEFHKRVQARGRCGAVRGRPAALTRAVCLLVETAPATAVAATPSHTGVAAASPPTTARPAAPVPDPQVQAGHCVSERGGGVAGVRGALPCQCAAQQGAADGHHGGAQCVRGCGVCVGGAVCVLGSTRGDLVSSRL